MKKIIVFIEGDSKELILDDLLGLIRDSYIYVKTASIYWNYVFSGYNDSCIWFHNFKI